VNVWHGGAGLYLVDIDGVKVPNVVSLGYETRPGTFPIVTIRIIADLYTDDVESQPGDEIAPWRTTSKRRFVPFRPQWHEDEEE
jgi:hypothetical protein